MTGRGRNWSERTVKLSAAIVVEFSGPGDDYTLVLHGTRGGAARTVRGTTTRKTAKRTNNQTEGSR
jgi:hypothetical protein